MKSQKSVAMGNVFMMIKQAASLITDDLDNYEIRKALKQLGLI